MEGTNSKATSTSRVPIYTNLSFSESPSGTLSLQWSSDGQVFILAKGSVLVMTPNYANVLKTPKSQSMSSDRPSDWFRTIIDFDKKRIQNWADVSKDRNAVVLGSLDVNLQAVALSPSHLTDDAGCIAAVLTSNMDLSLWMPDKDRLQGKWTKIQEVTPLLGQCSLETRSRVRAQVTSIAWSPQADFGIDPAPILDASFLTLGTRGGTLMFLRLESGVVRCLDEIKVADNWLTRVAFSPWTLVEKGKCKSRVACGTSDGGVNILSLTQSLTSRPSSTGFGPAFNVGHEIQSHVEQVVDSDKRYLTGLTWIVCEGVSILVVCKPGLVSLMAPPSSMLGWSGRRTLSLHPQKVSTGSSPLHSVSGLHYVPADDVLLVCISGGSIHAVHGVSSEPSCTALRTDELSYQRLSWNMRLAFRQTHTGKIKYTDVNRIHGVVPFNSQGALLWLQESCQPANLDYTYDARQHIMLVAAQLWRHDDSEFFLRELANTLSTAKTADGSPIRLIGPFLLYLSKHLASLDLSFGEIIRPSQRSSGPALREQFRHSLSRYLFGSQKLLRLRMKLAVADMISRSVPERTARVQCEEIACHLFNTISQIIVWTLIRHLTAAAAVLKPNDAPFVLRMTHQSSAPGCPPELVEEGRCLADIVQSALFTAEPIGIVRANPISEVCPACDAIIGLEYGAQAICANGHSWGRCSITSFILSTGMVRRCSVASWLPKPAQSWVVEELLEAASRCLFCGDIFVWSL
ncbi:hypothetical protein LshimejAT787_1302830 [Lyophyllum shimeji]|uniref:Transcription factor IIIC 90kDa subunit N-terminal domain-containing protein n=1 Tax=Lyophyllum shimeji TaxID=47721 RepID=A0A9P3PY51_LYOSH|nr:hypothetical protein LshimejAT787_1302830 [Lyophyllum shimeji]